MAAAATAARDTTRLEPLVSFLFVYFLLDSLFFRST